MNAKYVNAVPLYRQEKEFERYGLTVSRQDMAYWTIQCVQRYLAILYDYLVNVKPYALFFRMICGKL